MRDISGISLARRRPLFTRDAKYARERADGASVSWIQGETAFVSRHARCITEPSGVCGCDEGARSAPLLITPHKHESPPREEEVREAHANHRQSVRRAR